jgi:hypothetical protein
MTSAFEGLFFMKSRAGFIPRNEQATRKAATITPWYKDWQELIISIISF